MKIILFLFFTISIHAQSRQSGGKWFQSFYTGEHGVQYFIKPLKLKGPQTTLLGDWTFRHLDESTDSATFNYTVSDPLHFKGADSLVFSSETLRWNCGKPKLLFSERTKKGFQTRLSNYLPLQILHLWFAAATPELHLYKGDEKRTLQFSPKGDKGRRKINRYVFDLF